MILSNEPLADHEPYIDGQHGGGNPQGAPPRRDHGPDRFRVAAQWPSPALGQARQQVSLWTGQGWPDLGQRASMAGDLEGRTHQAGPVKIEWFLVVDGLVS